MVKLVWLIKTHWILVAMVTPGSSCAFPTKVAIILTLAVLLAHLVVLQLTPMALGLRTRTPSPAAQPARAFSTRTVARAPAGPPAAATAPAKPATPVGPPLKRRPLPPTTRTEPLSAPPVGSAVTESPTEWPPEPHPPAASDATTVPSPLPLSPPPAPQAEDQPPTEAQVLATAPRPPRDVAPAVQAYSLPDPVRLTYTVETNKLPFRVNSELLWQHSGDNFEARLQYSAFGQARTQTSRGEITPQGLAPLRFSDKYRSEVAAHFNRAQGKVTFSANTPDVPLLAGAQDRLSLLVQLAAMLAGAPDRYPEATTLAIQTIGPRDADTWLFTVGREEMLKLPGGEQATLKLVRNPRREYDQRVELWLAPALGYLPARIRITEANGDSVDQKWLARETLN